MAFDRKKEVIKNTTKLERNDIIADFGMYSNSNNTNDENLNFSSFESNFKEEVSGIPSLIEESSPVDIQNSIDSFTKSFDQNNSVITPANNNTLQENNIIKNLNNPIEEINNVNIETDLPIQKNINEVNIINNYDYNPIMNSIENIPKSIDNSEDINVALSNLDGLKSKKEEIKFEREKPQSQFMNYDIDNNFEEFDIEPGFIRCPKCGQKIREDYKECFICGTTLNKNTRD